MSEHNPEGAGSGAGYDVSRPHDSLFRAVFSDPAAAVGLLRGYLPESVSARLRWSTLSLEESSFLDPELRHSEADLLYAIQQRSGRPAWLYLLLEQQSKPDRWMRWRLHRYCCRIWERDCVVWPRRRTLSPIVPLVFCQGRRPWTHSTEFADLFPVAVRQWPWLPHWQHLLIDLAAATPETVRGELHGRVAQLTMMAAYRDHRRLLHSAVLLLAPLLARGADEQVARYVYYVYATQPREIGEWFVQRLRRESPGAGGDAVNYAEQLVQRGRQQGRQEGHQEGRQEGRREGQLMTIERLVRAGVAWSVIEEATGLDRASLRELQRKLGRGRAPSNDTG